jgi:signal transduction histidine kinase/CheY-like chemotaxis protein
MHPQPDFRHLFHILPDPYVVLDRDLCIQAMNPAYLAICGFSLDTSLGRPLLDVALEHAAPAGQQDVARVYDSLCRVRDTGQADHVALLRFDLQNRPVADGDAQTGGGQRHWELWSYPLCDAQGHIQGVLHRVLDCTQAVLQEQRVRLNEHAARQASEHQGRVNDDFLAILSHELRTPLNAILGWAQLLKMAPDPERVARAVTVIERNVGIQAQMVADLLDASSLLAGRVTLRCEPLDLREVVSQVLAEFQSQMDERRLRVMQGGTGVPCVLGDSQRLRQVVWNLLSNAIKFTPEGGTLSIEVDVAHEACHVWVRDSGCGIDPSMLEDIFDRFRGQAGAATRRHGGLGLGLWLVRSLVGLHGGTVKATSDGVGKGACFTVTLPFYSAPEALPADPGVAESYDHPAGTLQGLTVLVAEDNADAREFLTRVLGEAGAAVHAVADGAQACAVLETSQRVDVLLSDLGMPELDGYALLRRVRATPGINQAVPALAVTAFSSYEDVLRARAAGFDDVMAKPFQASAMLRAVARLAVRAADDGAVRS